MSLQVSLPYHSSRAVQPKVMLDIICLPRKEQEQEQGQKDCRAPGIDNLHMGEEPIHSSGQQQPPPLAGTEEVALTPTAPSFMPMTIKLNMVVRNRYVFCLG